MTKRILTIVMVAALFFMACNQTSKQKKSEKSTESSPKIEAKKEVAQWKKELIDSKKIGYPCNFKSISSPEAKQWAKDNPNQQDGLPSDDKEIQTIKADFDGDGKQDLLMFFNSNNCSGHNGGTPSFAKIVYANGKSNSNLMQEIQQSIMQQYNAQKATDKKMKEITDSYLNETVTISYKNGVLGEYKLYAKGDAHCCPSYKGNYTYNVKDKKLSLTVKANKK